MKFYSPLRYPGGKNKVAKFVALLCEKNSINGHYVEPYAGGASVALYLLMNDFVKEITINDKDRSIYAFWHSLINRNEDFCKLVKSTKVSVSNWRKAKEVQEKKNDADLLELGFSTFFLNRTNVSGVIDGGIIGGYEQKGKYKIDCRFNKKDLIGRITEIAKFKDKIHVRNLDALKLVKNFQKKSDSNTIFYFDPPYYLKGSSLYLHHYEHDDHKAVSEEIKKIKKSKWIVSYDDTHQINLLYRGLQKISYSFAHVAYEHREGKEVLYFSNNLFVPQVENPAEL